MGAKTTAKGEIGELQVMADLSRQGHDVAIPFGHNLPFDLIVIRKEDGRLEKVQVKYTTSDARVIHARIESNSAWVRYKYHRDEVDWIAVFDSTTDKCFYLPSALWHGYTGVNLRLVETANGQRKGIRFAADYVSLGESPEFLPPPRSSFGTALPFGTSPG